MKPDVIEEWSRSLRVPRRRRAHIARELRSHLLEVQCELEMDGWLPEDAVRESLARLGDPSEIATEFGAVYRRPHRKQFGVAVMLAGTLLMGVFGVNGSLASATATYHPKVVHVRAKPGVIVVPVAGDSGQHKRGETAEPGPRRFTR